MFNKTHEITVEAMRAKFAEAQRRPGVDKKVRKGSTQEYTFTYTHKKIVWRYTFTIGKDYRNNEYIRLHVLCGSHVWELNTFCGEYEAHK